MRKFLVTALVVILVVVSFRFTILWQLFSGHSGIHILGDGTNGSEIENITEVGDKETVNYELDRDFDHLDISRAVEAYVHFADEYKVILNVDKKISNNVIVKVEDDTLVISVENRIHSINRDQIVVDIYMPQVSGLKVSEASKVTIDQEMVYSDNLDIDVEEASKLDLYATSENVDIEVNSASKLSGSIDSENLQLDILEASKVDLVGQAENLELDVSDASHAKMDEFQANNLKAELSSASNAELKVKDTLESKITGASDLSYEGNPSLDNIDTDFISHLRQVN